MTDLTKPVSIKARLAQIPKERYLFLLAWAVVIVLPVILVPVLRNAGVLNAYSHDVLSRACIAVIMVVGLNLVNGFNGQFSIGHAGFMAVGGYIAAMLTTKPEFSAILIGPDWFRFLTATLVGGLVSAGIAFLIGLPSFRLRGDYLAVLTLAFNMIVVNFFTNLEYLGGPRGLPGVMDYTNFTWIWAWLIIAVVVVRNLVHSSHGRAIMSVRDNETAAELGGVDTRKYKLIAFAIGSFFAGVGGSLLAHHVMFINPSMFNIFKSFDFLLMLYLGGVGSITGSIFGAVTWTILQEILRELGMFNLEVWRLVIGPIILVILMIWRPKGLLGNFELGIFKKKEEGKDDNGA
jgi:branched-chain amino acid transport system permease protein